jgi:hypothetical protein
MMVVVVVVIMMLRPAKRTIADFSAIGVTTLVHFPGSDPFDLGVPKRYTTNNTSIKTLDNHRWYL